MVSVNVIYCTVHKILLISNNNVVKWLVGTAVVVDHLLHGKEAYGGITAGLVISTKRGEQQGDGYRKSLLGGLQTGACGASLFEKPWLYNHDPQPPRPGTTGVQGTCYCFSLSLKCQYVFECDLK